jgi:acyl-CoA synthetase (AMP-forming)/AMP-acid ligase II
VDLGSVVNISFAGQRARRRRMAGLLPGMLKPSIRKAIYVIKSSGEWISSIALENIAVSHPDVAEAAVINAKHERWQERPLLLVVPRDGRAIDTADLMKLYDGAVAKWWLPDAVLVVDELPHGATGKLNKLALRQKYQNYLLENPVVT